MKRSLVGILSIVCLSTLFVTGCGGGSTETTVVPAGNETVEATPGGIDEEEYAAEMAKQMQSP